MSTKVPAQSLTRRGFIPGACAAHDSRRCGEDAYETGSAGIRRWLGVTEHGGQRRPSRRRDASGERLGRFDGAVLLSGATVASRASSPTPTTCSPPACSVPRPTVSSPCSGRRCSCSWSCSSGRSSRRRRSALADRLARGHEVRSVLRAMLRIYLVHRGPHRRRGRSRLEPDRRPALPRRLLLHRCARRRPRRRTASRTCCAASSPASAGSTATRCCSSSDGAVAVAGRRAAPLRRLARPRCGRDGRRRGRKRRAAGAGRAPRAPPARDQGRGIAVPRRRCRRLRLAGGGDRDRRPGARQRRPAARDARRRRERRQGRRASSSRPRCSSGSRSSSSRASQPRCCRT